jgi:acyl-CoA reductase-like NAD-dependent aldehyde dehydrogenase
MLQWKLNFWSVIVYVYEDSKWSETLKIVDETSEYALTGAIFSQDRYATIGSNIYKMLQEILYQR